MSGRVASLSVFESGAPPLNRTKWSPPTRCARKICCAPLPSFSCHTTHGTVAAPGVRVPAATRGFSASWVATLLSEQASSAACEAAQGPKLCGGEVVSSGFVWPAVPAPTACQWKPPSAGASETPFAAKICSFSDGRAPVSVLSPFSYHTTHGTASLGPVNASSGSTPARVGSTFRDGSPEEEDVSAVFESRSAPTCCQQKTPVVELGDGLKPVQGAAPDDCFTPLETKIWRVAAPSFAAPSFSSHATHGTGSAPAVVAPPATAGFSAVRFVLMLSEGTLFGGARSCPSASHWPPPVLAELAAKRLAKICVWTPPLRCGFGSYQDTHGTVRPAPAKSIDGASAS